MLTIDDEIELQIKIEDSLKITIASTGFTQAPHPFKRSVDTNNYNLVKIPNSLNIAKEELIITKLQQNVILEEWEYLRETLG